MKKPFLFALCALPLAVQAADSSTIVVTASRTPEPITATLSSVTVITEDDIKESGTTDLTELLAQTPGFSVQNRGSRGSQSSVYMRGLSSNKITVLIDGTPVGSATTGSIALNHIPLESIEKIEIVRGPVSSLYGANAVAGVIQIFTKSGNNSETGFSGSVGVGVGSYETYLANANSYFVAENFSLAGSLSTSSSEGFDSTTVESGNNGDDDGFDEFELSISTKTSISDKLNINTHLLQVANTVEFDDPYGTDIAEGSSTDNNLTNANIEFDYDFADAITVSAMLGYYQESSETTSGFSSLIKTQATTQAINTSIDVSKHHNLLFGIDRKNEDVGGSDTAYDKTERDNLGVFSQWKSDFGLVETQFSARYDDNQRYGDFTTGAAAVGFGRIDIAKFVVSYGSSFRAPTFNDLYYPGYGNPDLKPEKAQSIEATLKGQLNFMDWSLSAYKTELEDMIAYDSTTFAPGNINKAEVVGFEGVFSAFVLGLEIDYSLSVIEAKDTETDQRVNGTSNLIEQLSIRKPLDNVTVIANVSYDSGRYFNDDALDSFFLLDLKANYQANDALTIGLAVNNLLDEDYLTSSNSASGFEYTNAGRNFLLTANYQF